ncbi:MAG: type I-U CRISPR-associated protein Csx17 [Kamptonema sp. SIO4C4]|nr:type I-U CRISPR-associated protein Csx17 [Kamptonema sp. SIO4C4]
MIQLFGCTPEPIAAYLKAVGVLRVLNNQRDSTIAGCWREDVFCLETELTSESLTEFFLHDYQPTPLVAPWNGSTGFYPKDKAQKQLLNSFCESTAQRFNAYKNTITTAQAQVNALGLAKQPTGEAKQKLLMRLRNTLPEAALPWLEACALVTGEEAQFPPLLGTGGNDGNFEFSRTFMQQLGVVLDIPTGKPTPDSEGLLKAALFDAILPNLNYTGKIGQFDPIAAGGANAAPGFDGESRVNPWDFIFLLEGAMLFMAGATRRYEQDTSGALSYPFTVRPSNVGYASAAIGDKSRAEIWLPLWEKVTPGEGLQAVFRGG